LLADLIWIEANDFISFRRR
jgi:hypothetical protein